MSLAHSSNLRSFAGFVHHRGPAFSLAPSAHGGIQENELPDKLIALVIREDEFDARFPAIAAKRIAAAKP
jgi:hypothetical protein